MSGVVVYGEVIGGVGGRICLRCLLYGGSHGGQAGEAVDEVEEGVAAAGGAGGGVRHPCRAAETGCGCHGG